MNPRAHQFALGGTVTGWTRLADPSPRQRRILRHCYAGWSPRVYSRYGVRQLAGPWPATRLVVKDPFALLSLPALCDVTGARPILIYRHPGAVLVSYRRMGWTPDVEEVEGLDGFAAYDGVSRLGRGGKGDDAMRAMGYFWSALHDRALQDLDSLPQALVVSHVELATGGREALRQLYDACGLRWGPGTERAVVSQKPERRRRTDGSLHRFNTSAAEAAEGWRSQLSDDDVGALEAQAGDVLARLERRRLRVLPESPSREVASDG
jgi:hypothetical protein